MTKNLTSWPICSTHDFPPWSPLDIQCNLWNHCTYTQTLRVEQMCQDVKFFLTMLNAFFCLKSDFTLDPDGNPGTFHGGGPQRIVQFWWKMSIYLNKWQGVSRIHLLCYNQDEARDKSYISITIIFRNNSAWIYLRSRRPTPWKVPGLRSGSKAKSLLSISQLSGFWLIPWSSIQFLRSVNDTT